MPKRISTLLVVSSVLLLLQSWTAESAPGRSAKPVLEFPERGEGGTQVSSLAPLASEFREALEKVHAAVEASGLKENELWSFDVSGGQILPARYPVSCDIQLWNLTDLAVEYELDRLRK